MEKRERKLNNKGFSLVELIIVIAIMAILVGVVGTQVLPYMEKSRKAKDMQVVSAIGTAAVTAFAEHAGLVTADDTFKYSYGTDDTKIPAKIDGTLKELLGVASTDKLFDKYLGTTTASNLESKVGKTATTVEITYTATSGEVKVQLTNAKGNVLDAVTSK